MTGPVDEASLLGPAGLPYGAFSSPDDQTPRIGVALGDRVLDLAALAADGVIDARGGVWSQPVLNPFMSLGRPTWSAARAELHALAGDRRETLRPYLLARDEVALHLPFEVADYVDFYSSESHATNAGRIFRPNGAPLLPNWKHLPVAYSGRAGTVVISGTDIARPYGQRRDDPDAPPTLGPATRLDIETEVGFVVGTPSPLGTAVSIDAFADHVFGVVLVNDWSARDIQAWESQPLGPFLSKSFATSISPWVLPLEALDAAWVPTPPQDPAPLPYLRGQSVRGLDLAIEVRINDTLVSSPPFRDMYWSPAQQLAHMTVNGASLRTGDLYASGTVSGWRPDEYGSLLELTRNGTEPITLADGTNRGYLQDGDSVAITATAPGADGARIGLGSVTGRVVAGTAGRGD